MVLVLASVQLYHAPPQQYATLRFVIRHHLWSQIDLPKGTQSGLTHAMTVLDDVAGITFTEFGNKDVVRHPLVQRVVSAYDAFEQRNASPRGEGPP